MAIYDVGELQPPDESDRTAISEAGCINASGLSGGSVASIQVGIVGATWSLPFPSSPELISAPDSLIFDVNDNGDAVGIFGLSNTATQHPFLLREGVVIDLVPPLPLGSVAVQINNNGLIAGSTLNPLRGFIYDSVNQTAPILIDPLPGQTDSQAFAINASGMVAGLSGGSTGNAHAFVFANGVLIDLGPAVNVQDINDSGFVVGAALNNSTLQPAIWETRKNPVPPPMILALPRGFFEGGASAINNNGDVVGSFTRQGQAGEVSSAFIFTGGTVTDLNTLIDPNSGWRLGGADDINDAGDIVGDGCFNGHDEQCLTGKPRGFILVPVSQTRLSRLQSKVIQLVGEVIGFQDIDGSGIVIVNGVPLPVGPWGPRVGEYAQKADIIVSLAVEEMATHIANTEGQVAVRRAALEAARNQIQVLLAKLREGE